MTALASASYQCPTRNHLMVVCGMPYRYAHFRQHGFYTGEIHRGTRLPHGLGKWRSPDASTHMEGEWFDGHLYMKIKPQQGHNDDKNTMKQPPERKMRRRASESDLPSLTLSPIMEHSRCSDNDDGGDKTVEPRKPKRRARRVTTDDSTATDIDRKKLSRSWTAGCNYDYDPPVPMPSPLKISKHPSIVHLDPIYCVPTSDSDSVSTTPTLTQKKSRFQEIKEADPVEEEKNLSLCREAVSPFQEVKDPPADHSFCQPCF